MTPITSNKELLEFCEAARGQSFMCVDTEFMRESTFFSILCLIQAATPDAEVIIDPLADGLDLAPFLELLGDTYLVKVMHSARQDLEIFYHLMGKVPTPVFDTQIAAMALGYGESVGYQALVKGELGTVLDKGARFTDWSKRPLSSKQLSYALGDVTYLRDLYPGMVDKLKAAGRLGWVEEDMQAQLSPSLYENNPDEVWKRLKLRSHKREYLAALKAAAAWRDRRAIKRNIPRRRVLKDDVLYTLAQQRPRSVEALKKLRGVPQGFERSSSAGTLIQDINYALDNIKTYAPPRPKIIHMPPNLGPAIDMLKILLRIQTEYEDIAPRLVASARDLEQIAAFGEKADVPAMRGWRREVFGNEALRLLRGETALRLEDGRVVMEPVSKETVSKEPVSEAPVSEASVYAPDNPDA